MNANTVLLIILATLSAIVVVLLIALTIVKKKEDFTFLTIIKYILNLGSFLVIPVILFIPYLSNLLWDLSLYSVFILMCIRPLHNLFPKVGFIRLMPLRKNLGIFSAIIVVGFGAVHYIGLSSGFFTQYFSIANWSFSNNSFFGHLGELTGFILLITSNKISMRILKRNWKRVQRLSYVYFFSGAWYVFASFNKTFGIIAIIIVFELTFLAYIKKKIVSNEIRLFEDKWENILETIFVLLLLVGSTIFTLLIINYEFGFTIHHGFSAKG